MAPPGQAGVADDDGINQLVGRDPGQAGFRDEPDPAGLCVAPGLTWFGAGLGLAWFWV